MDGGIDVVMQFDDGRKRGWFRRMDHVEGIAMIIEL